MPRHARRDPKTTRVFYSIRHWHNTPGGNSHHAQCTVAVILARKGLGGPDDSLASANQSFRSVTMLELNAVHLTVGSACGPATLGDAAFEVPYGSKICSVHGMVPLRIRRLAWHGITDRVQTTHSVCLPVPAWSKGVSHFVSPQLQRYTKVSCAVQRGGYRDGGIYQSEYEL
jgi:hypothetical protein